MKVDGVELDLNRLERVGLRLAWLVAALTGFGQFVAFVVAVFLCLGVAMAATSIPVRYGAGGCSPVSVTNASPPVLSCTSDPGWSNSDRVQLNLFAVTGPVYSPVNGLRYVKRLSGTTYELYSDSGLTAPLGAPGTYASHTGLTWAGKVGATLSVPDNLANFEPRQIQAWRCDVGHSCLTNIVVSGGTATATIPGGHGFAPGKGIGVYGSGTSALNTASGTVTATTSATVQWSTAAANGSYTDAAVSERAFTANPSFTALKTACAHTGYQQPGERAAACALWFWVDRTKTAERDLAKTYALSPELAMHGYLSCNGSLAYCSGRNDSDYGRFFLSLMAQSFSLLDDAGQISGGEVSAMLPRLFNSKSDAGSCTYPTNAVLTGTVSKAGAVLTGVGSSFTTQLQVGGAVHFQNDAGQDTFTEAYSFPVLSIASDTVATIGSYYDMSVAGNRGGPVTASNAWATGNCGALQLIKNHQVSFLEIPGVGTPTSGFDRSPQSNHGISAEYAYLQLGLTFSKYEPRAIVLVQQTTAVAWDVSLATLMSFNHGADLMGSGYGWYRTWMEAGITQMLKTSGYPDLYGDWANVNARLASHAWSGDLAANSAFFTFYGETSLPVSPDWLATFMQAYQPASVRATFQSWIVGWCGGAVTPGCLTTPNTGYYAAMGWDPQLTPTDLTALPLAIVRGGKVGSKALCAGAFHCQPTTVPTTAFSISRGGWSSSTGGGSDYKIQVGGGSFLIDHYASLAGSWWLSLDTWGNTGPQPHWSGTDSSQATLLFGNAGGSANSFTISSHTRLDPSISIPTSVMDRWSDPALNSHLYVHTENTGDFNVPKPTKAVREFAEFRQQGLFVVHSILATAVPGQIDETVHWTQNQQSGEGAVTCAGVACAINTNLTGKIRADNQAVTRYTEWLTVYPDPTQRGYRHITATNGVYGGNGYTWRGRVCATTNDTSCNGSATGLKTVDVISINTSLTSAVEKTVSTVFEGVEAVSGSGGILAMFATGADQASMGSVTTSGTRAVFVAGLIAGVYKVLSDGTPACSGVVVSGSDNSLLCASVPAGNITVSTQATWYVSTAGSSGNTGAIGSPWDLATAFSSSNVTIQPGDTVYLRAGTYGGHNVITKSGSAGNYVTYMPYQADSNTAPEAVVFDRNALTDGDNASIKIDAAASYVTVQGFEVMNSHPGRRSAFDTSNPTDMRPNGIESFGHHIRIIGNTIHDTGTALSAWSAGGTADGSEFCENVIFGNGWQSATGTERGHGHGVYMQNQPTGTKTLCNNFLFWNFDQGMQMYGSGDTGVYIAGFVVDGNTAFMNGMPSLPGLSRQLLLGGGQFCLNNTLSNNQTYLPIGTGAQSLNIGYSPLLTCHTFTVTGNYLIGGEFRIVDQRQTSPPANSTIIGNTVYATWGWEDGTYLTGISQDMTGTGTTVSGNTQITVRPGTNRITVQPSAYESNKCAVVVYNWEDLSSVAVDLSTCLGAGVAYKVVDVQNWGGAPVATGTYSGSGNVTIPVNLTAVRALIGANPGTDFVQPTHTTEFNAFVVQRDFSPPAAAGSTYRGIWRGRVR